jgi:hypothetical protein
MRCRCPARRPAARHLTCHIHAHDVTEFLSARTVTEESRCKRKKKAGPDPRFHEMPTPFCLAIVDSRCASHSHLQSCLPFVRAALVLDRGVMLVAFDPFPFRPYPRMFWAVLAVLLVVCVPGMSGDVHHTGMLSLTARFSTGWCPHLACATRRFWANWREVPPTSRPHGPPATARMPSKRTCRRRARARCSRRFCAAWRSRVSGEFTVTPRFSSCAVSCAHTLAQHSHACSHSRALCT